MYCGECLCVNEVVCRRLEELTQQLERIKRAKSHHEDDALSPES